ncbi:MAG: aldose epimerase family protein [Planctomycetia bacterium]|nr:aldose epimerase family protein [Planctomycetia bacterium]
MSKIPGFMMSFALLAALSANAEEVVSSIKVEAWGKLPTGEEVQLYTLANEKGMSVSISNYGGLITSLIVPDKDGNPGDVVLGFDTLEGYLAGSPYFGALVGRYGNRIANGEFVIDGTKYNVTKNENGITNIHGGNVGFDKKIWTVEPGENEKATWLKLSLVSPDGEEGFPGNLSVSVSYILPREHNSLIVLYTAQTDKATPINLTQHSYFNLKGAGNGDILDHIVTIDADSITPVDKTLITTGELMPVEGTAFDFRTPTAIGKRIDADEEQIKNGGGYDHNWVLNMSETEPVTRAAIVTEPTTGRRLEVLTTEPGVQFYCGNFLDGTLKGKGGKVYGKRYGFCLETQHFPNSPNIAAFPSTILRPGQEYKTATVFRFLVEGQTEK